MQTIYIDVLLGINLLINYFLILATGRFLNLEGKRYRFLISSAAGALYSLIILLPELPLSIDLFLKFLVSLGMVRIAWPYKNPHIFIKTISLFYIINFSFAGSMLILWYIFVPKSWMFRNSVIYFSVSPVTFSVFTVLSYIGIRVLQRITGRFSPEKNLYHLTIVLSSGNIYAEGCPDTGNKLTEPFSGYPVIIVDERILSTVIWKINEQRLIPFKTIGSEGILMAFKPKKVILKSSKGSIEYKNVYIGVCKSTIFSEEYSALIPAELIH